MRQLKRLLLSNIHLCRIGTPFYESQKFPKGHANGNGNFRMGLHTSSVRETTRQLVCRRSYLRQQILP